MRAMRFDANHVSKIVAPFVGETGGVISALRAIQCEYRCVPESVDAVVADAFNLSQAEVKGVISFYTDLRRGLLGGVEVRLCAAEACQAAGGRQLQDEVERASTEVDAVSFVPVYCLGLCSVAPAAMVGGKLVGRASCGKIKDEIIDQQKKGE